MSAPGAWPPKHLRRLVRSWRKRTRRLVSCSRAADLAHLKVDVIVTEGTLAPDGCQARHYYPPARPGLCRFILCETKIFKERARWRMLDHPGWLWGLLLIALTMAIHATAVVVLAFVVVRIRSRLESRGVELWNLIAILICIIAVIGLLLAMLHGIESVIWAGAYLWLGALDSPMDALLFSLDSMSTRGASGLTLQRPWQMMGPLEAVDGMLLFGVSTAYIFSVMQAYWSMLTAHVAPPQKLSAPHRGVTRRGPIAACWLTSRDAGGRSRAGRLAAIPVLRRDRGSAGHRALHDRRLLGLPGQGSRRLAGPFSHRRGHWAGCPSLGEPDTPGRKLPQRTISPVPVWV